MGAQYRKNGTEAVLVPVCRQIAVDALGASTKQAFNLKILNPEP